MQLGLSVKISSDILQYAKQTDERGYRKKGISQFTCSYYSNASARLWLYECYGIHDLNIE